MDDELKALIEKARAKVSAMSPAEYAEMIHQQSKSFVRAEMAFGSDADEREYRRRLNSGEPIYDTPSGAEPSADNPTIEQLLAVVDKIGEVG